MTNSDKERGDSRTNVRHLRPSQVNSPIESQPVPLGKLKVVVTYLQMVKPPTRKPPQQRLERLSLMRAHKPTVSFYRYLYNTVGERWLWFERRAMDDEALSKIIHDDKVSVYVLYVGGTPAGFAELDMRVDAEVTLAYFGLIPEFIGRGLGQYFLDWTVAKAWSYEPKRVAVNTCNLDHPKAVAVYQQAGFSPYRQEEHIIDDPRVTGLIPAND